MAEDGDVSTTGHGSRVRMLDFAQHKRKRRGEHTYWVLVAGEGPTKT
jgi:hypothetical protein